MTLPLAPILTVLGLAAYFCLLFLLIARAGGWMALAKRYPEDDLARSFGAPFAPEGVRFRFASISLYRKSALPCNYGGVTTIAVGGRGIGLRLSWIVLWHKPVFIPWSAVEDCSEKVTFRIFRSVQVSIREPKVRIGFQGKASKEVLEAWRRHKGLPPG